MTLDKLLNLLKLGFLSLEVEEWWQKFRCIALILQDKIQGVILQCLLHNMSIKEAPILIFLTIVLFFLKIMWNSSNCATNKYITKIIINSLKMIIILKPCVFSYNLSKNYFLFSELTSYYLTFYTSMKSTRVGSHPNYQKAFLYPLFDLVSQIEYLIF